MSPLSVLILASWYPGLAETVRGRFVADQAQALAAGGRVRPLVTSFDGATTEGSPGMRRRQVATMRDGPAAATRSRSDVISPGGWGEYGSVPVARLPVADGVGQAMPGGHEADLRIELLGPFLDRVEDHGDRVVIHAHTAFPDGAVGAAISRQRGWPLVITEHATFVARQLGTPGQRERYLDAAGAASRFVAVSDALAMELREAIPTLESRLTVIPNVVHLDSFTPRGLDGRRPDELLYVGYRVERKGIAVLLGAFAEVLQRRPAATLRLIGRPNVDVEDQRWRDLAANLGVAESVHFEPPASRLEVAEAMSRASVLVHASQRETFGVTTIEALASGLPVVATRSGGILSILEDQRLGELVPPDDQHSLADAILRTLERRSSFDPRILRRAVEEFSASSVAGRLVNLYQEILAERRPQERGVRDRTRAVSWSGAARTSWASRTVVIGLDTAHAAGVVSAMEPALRQHITLMTYGGPALGQMPDGLGELRSVVAQDSPATALHPAPGRLRRGWRRPFDLARHPIAWARWRRNVDRALKTQVEGASAMLTRAISEWADGSDGAFDVVCLKGADYLVAAPHVASGALRAVPGGVGWLGDQWASRERRADGGGQ